MNRRHIKITYLLTAPEPSRRCLPGKPLGYPVPWVSKSTSAFFLHLLQNGIESLDVSSTGFRHQMLRHENRTIPSHHGGFWITSKYLIVYWPNMPKKFQRNSSINVEQSRKETQTRMWANAQRDGRPAEYTWHPLFNATKFGWRPQLECRAVTLPRRETGWNLQGCPKLANRSQPLLGQFTILWGHVEEVSVFNKFFFQL